jgi:hypothetical protein
MTAENGKICDIFLVPIFVKKEAAIVSTGKRHEEKRAFPRMDIKAVMAYTISTKSGAYSGFCNNLSHSGIHFSTQNALSEGNSLEVTLDPMGTNINALRAIVEVLRVDFVGDNSYGVAGKIVEYK